MTRRAPRRPTTRTRLRAITALALTAMIVASMGACVSDQPHLPTVSEMAHQEMLEAQASLEYLLDQPSLENRITDGIAILEELKDMIDTTTSGALVWDDFDDPGESHGCWNDRAFAGEDAWKLPNWVARGELTLDQQMAIAEGFSQVAAAHGYGDAGVAQAEGEAPRMATVENAEGATLRLLMPDTTGVLISGTTACALTQHDKDAAAEGILPERWDDWVDPPPGYRLAPTATPSS